MFALPLIIVTVTFAQGTKYVQPELDTLLMQGVDDVYRMKFDQAEENSRKAASLAPDHPNAYMGLAGVAWTRYVYETDQGDDKLIGEFERWTAKTIDVAQKWLRTHPDDAQAMMTLGAAYGLSSRLLLIRQRWVSAYLQGRKALKMTKAAVKTDPELWDGYLGLGMYDYYSDLYPRFIGVLAKLVLRGDRKRGIEYLKTVAEKGHYSRYNAKILLVEIYTEDPFGAKDPAKAVALMKELRGYFPDSAMMHSAELVSLFTAGKFDQAADGAREYLKRVAERRYNAIEAGKGAVILGCALWALKRDGEALAAFRQAQQVLYGGRMSRWAVWASIKAGNLEDAMGRREDALKDYKLAIDEPDRWGFRALAKPFVSKPYALRAPDRIPPP
jgi:tetratricopeptide (TPR) repeat protein